MKKCIKHLETTDEPNFIPWFSEDNPKLWKILVYNLDGAFKGGQYIFTLEAPETFPHRPPTFSFDTPNGVFDHSAKKICISIGEFHAEDTSKDGGTGWRPTLGMSGFIISAINCLRFFDKNSHGIGVNVQSDEVKKILAGKSIQYNKNKLDSIYNNIIKHGNISLPGNLMEPINNVPTDEPKVNSESASAEDKS
jgi:ubiquitin-protein ligase